MKRVPGPERGGGSGSPVIQTHNLYIARNENQSISYLYDFAE